MEMTLLFNRLVGLVIGCVLSDQEEGFTHDSLESWRPLHMSYSALPEVVSLGLAACPVAQMWRDIVYIRNMFRLRSSSSSSFASLPSRHLRSTATNPAS